MALAVLSGFQLLSSFKHRLDFQESVLGGRRGDALLNLHQGRQQQMCSRPPVGMGVVVSAAGIATGKKEGKKSRSGKKGRSSSSKIKGVSCADGAHSTRGEPVMAFRDQVAVCTLASATLERTVLDDEVMPRAASSLMMGRELSPAGDSATSSERSRLEKQWAKFLRETVDGVTEQVELRVPREGEDRGEASEVVEEQDDSAVSSTSTSRQLEEKKVVSSGRPKARLRRLDARRSRMSSTAQRVPVEVFTIFPRKRTEGKSDAKKIDGVQGYVSTYMREITRIDRLTADEELMLSKIIRVGYLMKDQRKKMEKQVGHELNKQQWADILHISVAELDAKLHEAELARDRMVMANLRLVVSVVKQYNCQGLEVADLIQEGSIGLLKGVEKFDHTRGYKLSTYVHWWIRQGVTRAIADHSRTVRLPVHVHDALGRIRRAKARMMQDGHTATVESLGQALNLTTSQITTALKVPKRLKSLDMQIGYQKSCLSGDSETFHSLVADQHTENQPWPMVERAQLKGDVDKILQIHLGSREREIIKMHFGVDTPDGYPMSLENISHRYGISRERVRQLERAAKQKLQTTRTELEKYCSMLT